MTEQRSVLIVDDEKLIRLNLGVLLEDLGFSVVEAANGLEALDVFDRERPDLVLTDLRMPRMDGLALISALTKKGPDTPVVVISGIGKIQEAIEAIHRGAWDYISKPVEDQESFEIVIERVLERARLINENRRYREHLEELVRERTAELETANSLLQEESAVRSQAEQQIHLLNHALDHVREAAYLIDPSSGKILYVNEEVCRSLGYTRDELLCMSVPDIDPDFTPEHAAAHVAEFFRLGAMRFEARHRARDGRIFPVEITSSLIEFGDAVYAMSLARNIGERIQMEQTLRKSEVTFRTLAENSPDNIVRYDTGCRMIYVNPRMERTVGIPAAVLIGKTPMTKTPGEERREYQQRIEQVLVTGEETELDLVLPDSGEGERYHNIRFVAERGADGTVTGVLAIGRDITERKLAEEMLHAKQQRLTDMTMELSLTEERERRRIAAEIHDSISQTLLLGKIKLRSLIANNPDSKNKNELEEILRLQDEMIRSVRSLTQQLSPPILSVAGLEDALEWLGERMMEDYGLRVELVDDQSRKPLSEDIRVIVYQACRELLINVAKHAETESARVIIGSEKNRFYLTVEDRGAGFALSGIAAGGFGLFSIRERIKHLGGEVLIESAPGRGTSVTLWMALAGENE